MKETIDVPKPLLNFIKEKASELAYVSCIFFEYIIKSRDNYMEITPEMNPQLNNTMINYVIQNILGTVINTNFKYTTNYIPILKVENEKTDSYVNDFFLSHATKSLTNTLSYLIPTNNLVSQQGIISFNNYLDYILNESLDRLLSSQYQEDDIITLLDNYKESNELYDTVKDLMYTEGDNTLIPKSYNFIDDDDNIIIQTFIWLLCGLNDWLEKDYIEESDVKFMIKILTQDKDLTKQLIEDTQTSEDVKINIKEALFLHDFYTSEKAGILMSKLFSHIKNKNIESLNKTIKQLSIII